jgi:uncharacterized protein YyaL (SSP411 family)
VLALLLAVLATGRAWPGLTNQLAGHQSAYLAMHGNDPVHWQDWGQPALDAARSQQRLLFVSSGYFACHWCHVMQRESYRDPKIAALLNRYFVPVKVDRELLPALDAYLLKFVERTRGAAGWPLNVFLTPDGYPLVGVVYLPPRRFLSFLEKLHAAWEADGDGLAAAARIVAASSEPVSSLRSAMPASAEVVRQLRAQALNRADELLGGFGQQARFPMAPQLKALLEVEARFPDPETREFLALTLDQMARRGLRDHLDGGFFRYTADPDWSTPHFEKMLYTQALLVPLYLRAAAVLGRPAYRAVAEDTLDFVLRRMAGRQGGFVASLSALDAQGKEGGAYRWTDDQLTALLNARQRRAAASHWDLGTQAAVEDGFLPLGLHSVEQTAEDLGLSVAEARGVIEAARTRLRAEKDRRGVPADEKTLAAWNGLMLSALVAGARELKLPRYRRAASTLRDFLVQQLWDGRRLKRTATGAGKAALEDYVFVARGLSDWVALSGVDADRTLILTLVRQAWDRFYRDGGWVSGDDLLIPSARGARAIPDGALPSPSAELLRISGCLKPGAGEDDLSASVQRALRGSAALVRDRPFEHASQALLLLERSGENGDEVAACQGR